MPFREGVGIAWTGQDLNLLSPVLQTGAYRIYASDPSRAFQGSTLPAYGLENRPGSRLEVHTNRDFHPVPLASRIPAVCRSSLLSWLATHSLIVFRLDQLTFRAQVDNDSVTV